MIHIFREYEPKEIDRVNQVMKIILTSLAVLLLCFGCTKINSFLGLKDDNLVESLIEDVIESKVGISIDLTPNNPDDDDYSLDMWKKD